MIARFGEVKVDVARFRLPGETMDAACAVIMNEPPKLPVTAIVPAGALAVRLPVSCSSSGSKEPLKISPEIPPMLPSIAERTAFAAKRFVAAPFASVSEPLSASTETSRDRLETTSISRFPPAIFCVTWILPENVFVAVSVLMSVTIAAALPMPSAALRIAALETRVPAERVIAPVLSVSASAASTMFPPAA